jgi:tetratricopeptide (TPR) repeat protein
MILAFSKIFWKNALVSEVFSLSALLTISIFFLFQLWLESKNKKFFYWLLLVSGLGLAHHQAVILVSLLPLFAWFLLAKMWRYLEIKDYFLGLFLLILGYLPYLYILIVAQQIPPMNWENPQNINGLFRLITRSSYGSFSLTVSSQEVNFLGQSLGLLKLWFSSFSLLGLLLAALGFFKALKSQKALFFHSLFIILIVGFSLSFYSGMPFDDHYQIQYLERFQIITSLFLTIMMAFGLLMIFDLSKKPLFKKITLIIFLAIPMIVFIPNYKKVNQRNNYFGEYLAQDVLGDIPQDSILIFGNDALINSLLYQRYVLAQRQDISFIIDSFLISNPLWWHEEIEKRYPEIVFPERQENNLNQYFIDFLDLNSVQKPIVLMENDSLVRYEIDTEDSEHFQFIGLNKIYLLPETEIETISQIEGKILANYNQYQNLKNNRIYPNDWGEAALIDIYNFPLLYLAQINPQKAQDYYQKTVEINPQYAYGWFKLGEIYESKGEVSRAQEFWQKALKTGRANQELAQTIKEKLLWENF